MDTRKQPSSDAAHIDARDITPTTIAVSEVQGRRRTGRALAKSFVAVCPHALLCEGVAGTMTLNAGTITNVFIDTNRLLQARGGCAISACYEVTLSIGFQ